MPHPRPVSPLSFETCASPPYDIDIDDLIDSDDELDDDASALRRQRVEKLAQSYLQGKPLLILSASLKGPLDEKWKNPWKKNRKRGSGPPQISDYSVKLPESFVQETDLQTTKHQESLSVGSRGPEIPASSFQSPEQSPAQPRCRSPSSKSPLRESKQSTSRLGQGGSNQGPRSPVKPSGLPSSSAASHSAVPRLRADWLKKDRRLMNFTKFDPPSSPTTSIASRHSDKARQPKTRHVQVQVPQTPAFPNKSYPVTNIPAKTTQSLAHGQLSSKSTRPSTSNPHKKQKTSQFTHAEPSVEPDSVQVVNSSSQLPRFEYRRWHQEDPELSQEDESILQEETILHDDLHDDILIREQLAADLPPTDTTTDQPLNTALASIPGNPPLDVPSINHSNVQQLDYITPDNSEEPTAAGKTLPKGAQNPEPQSKDVGFADEEEILNEDENATFHEIAASTEREGNETEENTCEDLPSAQQIPAPLGASDRIVSLHSTAVPKDDTDLGMSTSLDTQLSTQAALLHAQKSFQEDLDSPAYYATTPGQNRAVHSPSGTNYSANVTPFYRVEESIHHDLEHNTSSTKKNRIQAMSTQFMLDAATPFTFSTEQDGQNSSWKPTEKNVTQAMDTQFMLGAATPYTFSTEKKQRVSEPFPDSSKVITPGFKRKRTHDESPSSPESDTTSMDYEYHSAESSPAKDEGVAHSGSQEQDQQSTADDSLPLDLDETAPNTHQDGQGVNQAVESFNLSQAIADAGSWLQQSFDFMKDTKGQNLQSQALNMHLS